ncbi:MAG: DUF4026 domain-containing protein [Lachnospira sp.]|nr:DUF4026 domain-containing protein [Lachnospira sp.]
MNRDSYMTIIPKNKEDLQSVERLLANLEASGTCKVISKEMVESDKPIVTVCGVEYTRGMRLLVEVDGVQYKTMILPIQFEIPPMMRLQHYFRDIDKEIIGGSHTGLDVIMEFNEDCFASYHAQLKIVAGLVPDAVAVLDDSAEKLLSGRWVRFAAQSNVHPAPRYIYSIQAVAGEEDDVWLHTHGLNRCGLSELEILNSHKETYDMHGNILDSMATRLIQEPMDAGEPMFLTKTTSGHFIVVTYRNWEESLNMYPDNILGGRADREEGHNADTSCVFVYLTHEDYENGRVTPVDVFDEVLKDNPIYMFTRTETERMKALALERISYMEKLAADKDNTVIVKIGLDIDEEFKENAEFEREHIWFEVKEVKDGMITAELTQDPYYVKGIKTGDVGVYSFDTVTDWIVFTPQGRLTPDDVYIVEE